VTVSEVRVMGPLVGYRDGFREELFRQGFTPGSASQQLYLMAHASRWLAGQRLSAGEFTSARVVEFLETRRAAGYTDRLFERALMPLLGYLRGLGVVPPLSEPVACTPVELLMAAYRDYLAAERGLVAGTVCRYAEVAEPFLAECERAGVLDLQQLTAGEVTSFVVRQCRGRRAGSAKVLVTGLRSLLRFLLVEGYTDRRLAQAVPTATGWSGGSLPRALSAEVIEAICAGCDRDTLMGLRDFAILTVLHRLGLRSGEVAALELADVDWHHGEIVVRGKGNCRERLPLPVDVGEALVGYLRRRPRRDCRAVFLKVHAPIVGLTSGGIADVVYAACLRAGVPAAGPHRLRHSAATATLAGGAPLAEVGQLLRHRSATTTAIYAKVDRAALRSLARQWPGGAA
jgi:integrase/recombinase XerD